MEAKKTSGYVIGFGGQMYTLWHWSLEASYFMSHDGKYHKTREWVRQTFVKNLSSSLDKAKRMYPNARIDLNLKGDSWAGSGFTYDKPVYEDYQFCAGMVRSEDIRVSDNVWQLNEVFEGNRAEGSKRRRVYARRRLIELGELVRYNWVDYDGIEHKYATPKQVEWQERQKEKERQIEESHFLHSDGEKVELDVKKVGSFGFETQYGYCHIITYESPDGCIYKYKGSTPPSISGEFTKIRATIKHNEYNGEKQNLIQRVKILS